MQEKKIANGFTLSPSDYTFRPNEELSKAASNPDFKKLLEFLGIEQPNGYYWSMPSANHCPLPIPTPGGKANLVDKLAKANLPDELGFFDLDLQDDLVHLKFIKRFLEETEKAWLEDANAKSRALDNPITTQLEEKPHLLKLLLCLEFEPPIEEGEIWKILREVSIKPKLNFLQRIIHLTVSNDKTCKGCQEYFRNLLLHLNKSEICKEKYSDQDVLDIKEASKHFRQIRISEWREENKEKIAKRMAERYQKNKDAIKAKPKDKEKQKKIKLKHYQKNRKEIALAKIANYQKNKDKYSEKYNEKRMAKMVENHNQEDFEKYKEHFSNVLRQSIEHFEKQFVKVFMKNIDKLMAKSDEMEMQRLILAEERIANCKKQLERELKSGEVEVANTSFIEEIKKILNRVDKALEKEKHTLVNHIGKILREMCHENYENYLCPECIQEHRGRCSSCKSFDFALSKLNGTLK